MKCRRSDPSRRTHVAILNLTYFILSVRPDLRAHGIQAMVKARKKRGEVVSLRLIQNSQDKTLQ